MYHADNVLSSVVKWEGKCLLNFDLNSSLWNKQEAELQFEFEFKNYILDKLSVECWLKFKKKIKRLKTDRMIEPFYMYI